MLTRQQQFFLFGLHKVEANKWKKKSGNLVEERSPFCFHNIKNVVFCFCSTSTVSFCVTRIPNNCLCLCVFCLFVQQCHSLVEKHQQHQRWFIRILSTNKKMTMFSNHSQECIFFSPFRSLNKINHFLFIFVCKIKKKQK